MAAKKEAAEGKTSVLGGTGGEETYEIRGEAPADMSNWERVVDLVRAGFGRGGLRSIPRGRRWS